MWRQTWFLLAKFPGTQQSSGWGLIITHLCPQFWRSKKNSNSIHFIELYFGVLEQIHPPQPICQAAEFKFESKFKPLLTSACRLAITPEDYLRRQSKDLTAKLALGAKLLGQCSGTAWAGLTGEHKHRGFPSLLQSLRASTGSLEENMLPILQYWLTSTVKKSFNAL